MFLIYFFLLAMFIVRLAFLKVSLRNEAKILAEGGQEYGVSVSKAITVLHIGFYVSCAMEVVLKMPKFDSISLLGLSLMVFSVVILKMVTDLLGDIWTIKLMLVNNHQYVDHWLFRNIKHPNYFLNIVPELIGITLLTHAWMAAIMILPIYAVFLYLRIREENQLLAEVIIPNGSKAKDNQKN